MKKIIGAILCFGLVGVVMTSCKKTPQEKADWIVKKITRKLDLDDNQKEKLNQLKVAVLEARARHKDDKKEMFSSVKSMVLSEQVSEVEVKNLIKRRQDIYEVEFPQVFPQFQAFHASLSEEQKKKAVAIMDKFFSKGCGRK